MEDVKVKPKAVNDFKLPFELTHGIFGKLTVQIPWKSNFSSPTIIDVENVDIVLNFISPSNWEFIDYYSYDVKLKYLETFFTSKITELKEALNAKNKKPIRSDTYLTRLQMKIIDNLHINFKNIHIRLEDNINKPFSSMGFTLEEILIVNTNENWEETFINRTDVSFTNNKVYKLLKIKQFGFYLDVNTTTTTNKTQINVDEVIIPTITDEMYLIKPVSVIGKMEQIVNNLTDNLKDETTAKMLITIHLDKLKLDLNKNQYDKIVNILNHISLYQRFQYCKYDSQKYNYYKRLYFNSCGFNVYNKDTYMTWWKYAIKMVMKRNKMYLGNYDEFKMNSNVYEYYKKQFNELFYQVVECNCGYTKDKKISDMLNKDNEMMLRKIIEVVDLNVLYTWEIDIVQKYFKKTNIANSLNPANAQRAFFMSFFGQSSSSSNNNNSSSAATSSTVASQQNLLSKEEEAKIEEIFIQLKEDINTELKLSEKYIKFKVVFTLNEGSITFTSLSSSSSVISSESFTFIFKSLYIIVSKSEISTYIETTLSEFNINMNTTLSKNNTKTIKITTSSSSSPSNIASPNNDYIWKLQLRLNDPKSSENSSLNFHIKTFNILYHQRFIECIISFFVIKSFTISDDLMNYAYETVTEIKTKTSEQIKHAISNHIIVNITIDKRTINLPINKYNMKQSKYFIADIGSISISNACNHSIYVMNFNTVNLFYNSDNTLHNAFQIINNLKFELTIEVNKDKTIMLALFINNAITVNLSDEVYYVLMCIKDILQPITHHNDYYDIIEDNIMDIKKNCKIVSKVNKKNNLDVTEIYYKECFSVISGGYIYFFDKVDDEYFSSYFYIKNAVISIIDSNDKGEINIQGKYDNINLQFGSKQKMEKFLKILRERINEINIFANDNNNNNVIKESDNDNVIDPLKVVMKMNVNVCALNILLFSNKDMRDPYLNLNTNNNVVLNHIYTFKINEMCLTLTTHPYDYIFSFSIGDIELLDEAFNKPSSSSSSHNNNLYQLLTSKETTQNTLNAVPNNNNNNNKNILNVDVMLINPKSPLYKNSSIVVNITIGYLYCIWNPYSIRKLLFFIIHNDIFKQEIKRSCMSITPSMQISNSSTMNTLLSQYTLNEDNNIKPTCNSNNNTLTLLLNASFSKLHVIWLQPVTCENFIEILLGHSTLHVEMTIDHFTINGILGNVTMYDLSNYANNTLHNNPSTSTHKTTILSFQSDSSLTVNFTSYSYNCPLLQNNYTSTCLVVFNSVRLNFIHEHFFRCFHYIFDEFLNSLQIPPLIRKFRNANNKIPLIVSLSSFEFTKIEVMFKNPQIQIKPYDNCNDYFLIDLGIINVHNTYSKVKGKIRQAKEEERYMVTYTFKLENMNITSTFNNNTFVDNTDGVVLLKLTSFMNNEDNFYNDDILDKSFTIDIVLDKDVKVNLTQSEFGYLLKTMDWNVLFRDGNEKIYEYKQHYITYFNVEKQSLFESNSNSDITINNNDNEVNINVNNYIAFNINVNIKCLTLKLYDNYYKEHFLSFTLSNTYINFINKLNKQIELYINFQNVKAIAMKSQLLFEYKQQEADDDVNNKNKTQFTIRIVSDPDKDKNLILKVTNLKFIINIAMFNLIKTFFMEIPPYEQPLMINNNNNNNSGNSSSSGNVESKPSFRMNLDIKNILICLPTSNDECFCLSTDLFLLYKTARIDQAKRELVNTFNLLTWKLNNESNVYIKQQLEKELSNNTKEISHLNISFYDISPFTSTISQLTFNQSHMNGGINNNTKRFLTKFNFNFISSTSMQFRHPNNFILSSHSNISIKQLLCKVAYTDVIVLINAINHNFNTHISSFPLTNTNNNANTSSDNNNNTSYKVQKMNESLIQLNATNNSSSSNITEKLINKGMGIDEIECDIIQITLIDNHSHTFFPFLSLVLKHIKLIKENYNIKQNTINIEFVCKVIIYNYYAGEWEPLLESTKVLIDKTTDNTYTNMNITSHHFNININNDLNINISDLSIAFLYSTFKLWYHNFTSLLLQNKTQLINQHTNSKVSNHRVINLSGRTMTVYETTTVNSANSVDKKQLCVLRNGEYYDIEYQEDAFIERKKKKKLSNTTNNSVNSSSTTTTSSIRNDKAISIHFDDISIGANTILIDNITTKKYKINTTLLKQQYNTHNELSQFEYLMSEVKITNLKKTITICSPLIFHNQLSKTLYVNLSKKNYTTTSTLKPNETLAIGYEYFDGNISFKIGNDDEQERGCDVRTFLDKEFTNYEMRFDDTRICFFNLKKKMKYVIAIVICSPVVVDNCLPLNIEFVIKGNKICVGKGEKEHVDNISLYNELVCERGEFVVGRYVNKGKVVFYDNSSSNSNSSSKNGSNGDKKRKDVVTKYIDMCYREDESGNSSSSSYSSDINILVTLINSQYKDSNVRIIFHCSGLIYNNTNLPIYAIPSDNNSSSNAVSNTNTNKNENIHILSYQQNNLTFTFTKPNTNTLYSSNTVSLNTIGIITSLTFLPNNNNNSSSLSSLNHEFILENTFSPITQDPTINILTNIITIHPKYILCNKTTYPFYYFIPFSMENFSDISPQNSNELCPGLLQPYTSQTVFFSNDFKHKIRLRPIEEQCTYQSGSKWNWSGLINVYYDNIITVQFEGKGEKKYFNIEKKVKQYTTYVIIDETTLHNSKYVIINETENIILNAYEPNNKAMSNEVILPQCNAVFGWNSNMSTKTMRVELLLVHNNKSISDKCKYSVADVKEFEFRDNNNNNNTSNNSSNSNSSNDDKIYINGKECSFPVCEIISLTKTNNNNNIHNVNSSSSNSSDIKIKFEISTNGMRKVIKISPYTSTSASPFETNIPTHTTTYEFTTKINQLGINIITDNRYLISSHKHNYTRNELAFISFKHIHTYYKSERFINSTAYNVDMQCKIKYIQIDNMQHYITQYPIILHMIPNDIVNNSGSSSSSSNDDNNNRETHPFFNIAASYSKGDVKQNEPIKFTYFSYLIQAFYINIDNEIFEGVVGFINSITQQLNTSINKVHPILRKNTTTINSSSNTCNNVLYLEPEWLNNNNIISNSSNIFFTHFESSSIEMILSFKASSALEQFLTSNPLFTKVLSSLSNIEHSHLLLNGSFMNNLYISYPNLINLILNQYKQHFLTKLLTIVGSIEILGNPLNLFRSLSIGVKDFVTKPIEGIVRGPLDGVEGAIQGGYSLIKHTINGAFSYTSNIASGISKSILHLSQDDTYIKAIEKEKIETQPKNFVFGLGYGISSLCNGVFSGICDAVIKPIEETQKKGITGLGTGIVKGIGGLFSKPVVGVLQLVSNTSDGIKNTFQTYNDDECGYAMKCKQIRRKRPFYGKFKCIKKYNVVHAKLLEFVVMEIEVFKNAKRKIDFVDVETYRNVKGEDNIVLFLTKSIVFVDVIRRCVKEEIPFTVINKAEVDKRKESVCIYFNKEFKGKIQAEVYLKKGDCEEGDSIAKKVNAYVKQ